jgi:hypothetical protein
MLDVFTKSIHYRTNKRILAHWTSSCCHFSFSSSVKRWWYVSFDALLCTIINCCFHSVDKVMECTYSLVYALKKFKYDPDCDLFLGCLEKLLPQELRAVQPIITNDVLTSCRKRDLRVHKETLGYLSLDELLRALKDVKIFLYKSDEAFLALQVLTAK